MSFDFIARKFNVPVPQMRPPEPDVCSHCEGGGWVLAVYQAVGGPNFECCPECFNQEGRPCP